MAAHIAAGTTHAVDETGHSFLVQQFEIGEGEYAEQIGRQFLRECEALAQLDHPLLSRIVDFSAQRSLLHLTLEDQKGACLLCTLYPEASATELRAVGHPKLPSLVRVTRWATQLAEVMSYLHDQQPFPVFHRNLNPLTVKVCPVDDATEDIRLADRGFLSAFRRAADSWGETRWVGPFVDPGLAANWCDPRTDVYAFGRTLDFMLTGTIPQDPFDPPGFPATERSAEEGQRGVLAHVVARCCQPALDDRYPGMTAVLKELTEAGSASPVEWRRCACGRDNRPIARFCARCGFPLYAREDVVLGEMAQPLRIEYDQPRHDDLAEQFQRGHTAPLWQFRLREAIDEIQVDPGFDDLISLGALPLVKELPHQRDAALTALKRMRGRALLADEVGLGKTIEAAVILKELLLRGLAQRVVIFCPLQLLAQWQSELYEKFDEIFLVMGRDVDTALAWRCPRLIATYEAARQPVFAESLLSQYYDLVILDEAHRLNYPLNADLLRIMKTLQKKYFLLLSATPMHDSLSELYNIVTLLRPGHFGDLEHFKEQFVDQKDEYQVRNVDQLRGLLQQIMIRNTRHQVSVPLPRREADTIKVELEPAATRLYQKFRDIFEEGVATLRDPKRIKEITELVERLCSSPDAFEEATRRIMRDRRTLRYLSADFRNQLDQFAGRPNLAELVEPKVATMLRVLPRFIARGQHVLVFSRFNRTAKYLHRRIRAVSDLAPIAFLYDEETSDDDKYQSLRSFKAAQAGILVCPGEASEGLNLQFASAMVNFDLPWDPMELEQRIGRIQRLESSAEKIDIVNLVLKDTIEDYIIEVCQKKIGMFENTIGRTEAILGELGDETYLLTRLANVVRKGRDENPNPEQDLVDAIDGVVARIDEKKVLDRIIEDTAAVQAALDDF